MKSFTLVIRNDQIKERAIAILTMMKYQPLVEVAFKDHKAKKSLPQLRTVHKWIGEVRDHFQETQGEFYTIDSLKLYFKGLFGVTVERETPSGVMTEYKSFADYKQDEMMAFMGKMEHYCASELQIFLTIPGVNYD